MNKEDFTPSASGKLIQNLESNWTFVPDSLPPTVELTIELLSSLGEANLAIGQLSEAGRGLPNPYLLIGPFQRREAIISSRIEGTIATAQELLLFEVEPDEATSNPSVREVANYVKALEHGLNRVRGGFPISLRLLREIHEVLMSGVRGEEKKPGTFRTTQNFIGKRGQSIGQARFVPADPRELPKLLDDFEKYRSVLTT